MKNIEKVKELTLIEFNEFIKEDFVLIDFSAEWCMPCLMMTPIIEKLSEKFQGKIKFGKINVSENQDIAMKYNVSSIPNFTLLKNGEIIERFIGSRSSEEFEEKLKKFLE